MAAFKLAGVEFSVAPVERIPDVPLRIINTALKDAIQITFPSKPEVGVVTQLLQKVAGATPLPADESLASAIVNLGDRPTANWLRQVFAQPVC